MTATSTIPTRADQLSFDLVVTPMLDAPPPAPRLSAIAAAHLHWPFPGMTVEDSARSGLSKSTDFADVIAWTIRSAGGGPMTDAQVKAALPRDWLDLLGKWAHGNLTPAQARERGIRETHVGGGIRSSYAVDIGREARG